MSPVRIMVVSLLAMMPQVGHTSEAKAPAADDPISATKRELETLKAQSSSPASGPLLNLPPALDHASFPEQPGGPGFSGALGLQRSREAINKKAKSANWLVDGVQKNAARADSFHSDSVRGSEVRRGQGATDEASESDSGTGERMSQGGASAQRGRTEHADQRPDTNGTKGAGIDNPLNRYMGEWLSPQDFSLLKKSTDSSSAAGGSSIIPASNSRSPGDSVGFFSPPTPAAKWLGDTTPAGSVVGSPRRENPYLQPSSLPSVSTGNGSAFDSFLPAPNNAAMLPPPPSAMAPPPRTEPKSPPFVPDNLKRSDDAKYFPQLKRF